jgi:predicted phage tail protein
VIDDFAPCTGPKSYDLSAQPDGTYTFSVRAVDSLGNPSSPATDDYTLARTPPAAPTITSKPGSLGQSQHPAWDFTSDPGTSLECSLARGSTVVSDFATCTGPSSYDLGGQPDGTYTFSVRAVDAVGNVSAVASDDYTLDTTPPPVPSITSAPAAVGRGASPAWGFTVAGDATPQCRLNRAAVVLFDFTACASPSSYDLSGQPDASYTFSVRAVDAVGNTSAPASSPYGLDRAAPASPVIVSAPASPGRDQKPSFVFSGDADATLQCRLWHEPAAVPEFSQCTAPRAYDLTQSPDGSYTFDLDAVDAAGNESGDVRYAYLLDTTPPAAPTITARPDARTADGTPTWKFTGEEGATFACSLTSSSGVISAFSSCTGKRTYDLSKQNDGNYTFRVRATDLAGNQGAAAKDTFTLARTQTGGGASGPSSGQTPPGAPTQSGASPSPSPRAANPPTSSPAPTSGSANKGANAAGGARPGRALRHPTRGAAGRVRSPAAASHLAGDKKHKRLKHRGLVPTLTQVAQQVAQVTGKVAQRSAFPAALLLLVAVFMGLQNRIDRNDPKLALAPVYADPELDFEPPRGPGS